MMKNYEELKLQIVWIEGSDVITTSPTSNDNAGDARPGWDV